MPPSVKGIASKCFGLLALLVIVMNLITAACASAAGTFPHRVGLVSNSPSCRRILRTNQRLSGSRPSGLGRRGTRLPPDQLDCSIDCESGLNDVGNLMHEAIVCFRSLFPTTIFLGGGNNIAIQSGNSNVSITDFRLPLENLLVLAGNHRIFVGKCLNKLTFRGIQQYYGSGVACRLEVVTKAIDLSLGDEAGFLGHVKVIELALVHGADRIVTLLVYLLEGILEHTGPLPFGSEGIRVRVQRGITLNAVVMEMEPESKAEDTTDQPDCETRLQRLRVQELERGHAMPDW